MSTERFCILCSIEHLEAVRAKINGDVLHIPCNSTGEGEPTHMYCEMALPQERIDKYLSKQEFTIMEVANPTEFLEKWNLKIIK